jgi:hypothetical protein
MDFREIGLEDVNWIYLAQDTNWWWILWTQYWTFGFHKRWGISWLAEHTSINFSRTLAAFS